MATRALQLVVGSASAEPISVPPRPAITWKNRDADLEAHPRWMKEWPVMFYRPNHYVHSECMGELAKRREIVRIANKHYRNFDLSAFYLHCVYHDDPERIDFLGDVPLREKILMNEEELEDLKGKEILAVQEISRIYSRHGKRRIDGYAIKDVLMHAILKDTKEAQYGSVVDKLVVGFCEALHEVLAGNAMLFEAVDDYRNREYCKIRDKYTLIPEVFSDPESLFYPRRLDLHQYFDGGRVPARPHTLESLRRPTGIPVYELWKEVMTGLFGPGPLIRQTEFYPETK